MVRLVMLSTNWTSRTFLDSLADGWLIQWAEIVHQTAVFGLQVDDS